MEDAIQGILKRNRLSVTDSRVKILELFLSQNGALAHGDIEKRTGERFDRVTVYRTLNSFLNKGIIHTIPTADNSIRYALCKENCEEGHHHDNHVHFVCDDCGNTICLDEVTIPEIKLPNGFTSKQVEMVVSGTCSACN
ncbi:Fur family transcriptional regulator [Flavihumibacter fluvii]|uniref:Fur family transcriptional regulator n=1 Tax=Flavihumibacter fluvii TaxID=2838157 RepID=UPI001BDE76DA|nr:Fur family transcriptional regulator [Flavihumibacter fluvii]ULQ51647.1 transcriptional repressor [Flavihumibacter fluvii]